MSDQKMYGLRKRYAMDYTSQLDTDSNANRPSKRIHKEPLKPRYILDDPTVMNERAFMIAQSGLKHNMHGVF